MDSKELRVKVTPEQHTKAEALAGSFGMSISAYIRYLIIKDWNEQNDGK